MFSQYGTLNNLVWGRRINARESQPKTHIHNCVAVD